MSPSLQSYYPLKQGRVHEAGGPGAWVFAAATAGQMQSRVLWVRERWLTEQLNPTGLAAFLDPALLLVASVKDQTEALAVAEEALKTGELPLTVVELTQALSLTAGRRLQLAAKAGRTLGLCLIPEGMGSNAAETRWHCAPRFHAEDSTRHRWTLIKNKSGTLGAWDVRWDPTAHRIAVVSPVGERPGSAGTSG